MELIDAASSPYLYANIGAKTAGVLVNPTAFVVTVAVVPAGTTPAPGDFKAAVWVTDSTGAVPIYSARTQIGPGTAGITLVAGRIYTVHAKIAATPEVIILRCGQIQAY